MQTPDHAVLQQIATNIEKVREFFSNLYFNNYPFTNAEQRETYIQQYLTALTTLYSHPLITWDQRQLLRQIAHSLPEIDIAYQLPIDADIARAHGFFANFASHEFDDAAHQHQVVKQHLCLLDALYTNSQLTPVQREQLQQIAASLPAQGIAYNVPNQTTARVFNTTASAPAAAIAQFSLFAVNATETRTNQTQEEADATMQDDATPAQLPAKTLGN